MEFYNTTVERICTALPEEARVTMCFLIPQPGMALKTP